MALSDKRTPDWWLAATKHVLGDNTLSPIMVAALAEIGWKSAFFLAGSSTVTLPGPHDTPGPEALVIEIPISYKCPDCRCSAGCWCCTEEGGCQCQ